MNLRCLRAACLFLALGPAAAQAAGESGFYAGIYAGSANRNDAQFHYDMFGGVVAGPGSIETPGRFVNDGIDPYLFKGLNEGVLDIPFADGLPGPGAAGGLLVDGLLSFGTSRTAGLVVGYGLGNGVRIEADLSTMGFDSGMLTETAATNVVVDGVLGSDGTWTWSELGSVDFPTIEDAYPLSDEGFAYRTDVQFLLVGAYYDFSTGTPVSPYLGAGAGIARVSATMTDLCACGDSSFSNSTIVPAAQLGGGVRIAIADPVTLDFGYRLKVAQSPELSVFEIDTTQAPSFLGFGMTQSGLIAVHTLQAGLTVALP